MKLLLQNALRAAGNFHVTTKLMAAFGIMLALTILVSFEGVQVAGMLDTSSQALFKEDLSGISAIKEAAIFQVKCTRILRDMVLASGDKDVIEDQKAELSELEASVDEWLNVARQASPDSESRKKLDEIREKLPALRNAYKQVADLAFAGNQKAALISLKATNKLSNYVNLTIAEICRFREEAASRSRAQCETKYRLGRIAMLSCAVFSVVFAGALCLLTVRMIATPLTSVVKTLQRASSGDLTARLDVRHRDEIGLMSLALNEALESTLRVLQNVRKTASNLGVLSAELATTADGMARGAQAQAAGLEETSASLEQITATARNNAEHARQANAVAMNSREAAQKGHLVVVAAVHAMDDINQSSEKISHIASAVDDVAFQTNLLSVNAAIEAARAGEMGKTFAVVAEEIRALSKCSAESARDIRRLIKESLVTVAKGSVSIHESGETLKGLSTSVSEVTDFVKNIVTSSEEQSIGVEQVHSAVLNMDRVTQANVLQASRLSSAAFNLSSQASDLQSMLSRFTLDMALESAAAVE